MAASRAAATALLDLDLRQLDQLRHLLGIRLVEGDDLVDGPDHGSAARQPEFLSMPQSRSSDQAASLLFRLAARTRVMRRHGPDHDAKQFNRLRQVSVR